MRVDLTITNPKTGLSKVLAVEKYSAEQLTKTYEVYLAAGYSAVITYLGADV